MVLGASVSVILAVMLFGQQAGADAAPRPTPVSPVSWLSDDDYPTKSFAQRANGTTGFLLRVDMTGKVTDCRVAETSGFLDLDQTTCAVLLIRGKFKPARDASGAAIASIYKGTFTWKFPGDSDKRTKAMQPEPLGIELNLRKLPTGYERPALLRVHFTSADKPDSCRAEISSGSLALDKVACEQAMAQAVRPDKRPDGLRPDTRMVQVSVEAPKTQ
jgi:hypothetical protein